MIETYQDNERAVEIYRPDPEEPPMCEHCPGYHASDLCPNREPRTPAAVPVRMVEALVAAKGKGGA